MADKQKKRFKWKTFSLLAYLFATAVGYLYATGYYGTFGIDILNYVEPIDFLLISLDNVREVLTFSGLIVPFILPSIILILAGVISLGLILVLASLAVYLSLVLILCSSSLLTLAALAAIVAMARHIAHQSKWMAKALRTTFGQQGTEEERPSTFGKKIQGLVTAYKKTAEAHPSKPAKKNDHLTNAGDVIQATLKVWSWIPQILRPIRKRTLDWMGGFFESESSWRPKGWTSLGRLRQLVVVVTLAYIGAAAYVNGGINAQKVRVAVEEQAARELVGGADVETAAPAGADTVEVEPAVPPRATARQVGRKGASQSDGPTSVETLSKLVRSVICRILPLSNCGPKPRPVRTYAVPTSNLASLELNECKKEDVSDLKYARAHLRQDVSDGAHHATSDCHVYLGATGSMQFLADFRSSIDEPAAPPVEPAGAHPFAVVFDARSGAVFTDVCDLELAAVIGPFETGGAKVDGKEVGRQCTVVEHGDVTTMSMKSARVRLGSLTSGTLVLVGRADIRPINNVNFKSNMQLVRKRVKKVQESLEGYLEHWGLSVLSVAGGPVDSSKGDDPCSRIVEIYGCPANSMSRPASANSDTDEESRGEEAPSSDPVGDS